MTGVGERVENVRGRFARLRRRRPLVDHLVVMQEHYGAVAASQQAGAITYFGFLSFFPLLALAVFVVGLVAGIYPDAHDSLTRAVDQVIPGMVGSGEGQVDLADVQRFSGLAGLLGLGGVLYTGLGWISAMREALEVVFEQPRWRQPSFVGGKVRDLVSLVAVGLVLFVSVVVAGLVTGFSDDVLGWLHLGTGLGWLLYALTRLVGLAVNVVLFFVIYELVARPRTPAAALWQGAALAGAVFELLKAVSFLVLASAQGSPAFQAFGVALVLVVWMNYTSRVTLYGAAFAHTAPVAVARREAEAPPTALQGPQTPALRIGEGAVAALPVAGRRLPGRRLPGRLSVASFLAGAVSVGGALVAVRLGTRPSYDDEGPPPRGDGPSSC